MREGQRPGGYWPLRSSPAVHRILDMHVAMAMSSQQRNGRRGRSRAAPLYLEARLSFLNVRSNNDAGSLASYFMLQSIARGAHDDGTEVWEHVQIASRREL